MNTRFQHWLGGSLAIAIALGSGRPVFSQNSSFPAVSEPQSTLSALTIAMSDSLENITWQLSRYRAADGSTVEAFSDRPATFQFKAGRMTGTTGCNRFFGAYDRQDDQVTITPGGSTMMACFPEALAAQEANIMAGLPQVVSYTQTDDQLLLLDREGSTLFTLTRQPTAALTGMAWTLTVYNNGRGGLTTPMLDTTITAQFDTEGNLSGSAGCNQYRTTFEMNGDRLTVGPASNTRCQCAEPEGIMAQESAFLALLEDVATYSITGNQLELKNAKGKILARFSTDG